MAGKTHGTRQKPMHRGPSGNRPLPPPPPRGQKSPPLPAGRQPSLPPAKEETPGEDPPSAPPA